MRDDVQKAMELKRSENQIGKSLEAKVTLCCPQELYGTLAAAQELLPDILPSPQKDDGNPRGASPLGGGSEAEPSRSCPSSVHSAEGVL